MLYAVAVVVFIFHVLPFTTPREQLKSGIFIWHYAKIILIFHCSSFNTLQEAETIALYWETRWGQHGHGTRDTPWQLIEERRSVAGAQASFLKRRYMTSQ